MPNILYREKPMRKINEKNTICCTAKGVRSLLIRKRYVYLDAPMKIENKTGEAQSENENQTGMTKEEILDMIAKANVEAQQIISTAESQASDIIRRAQEEYNMIVSQANQKAEELITQVEQEAMKSIDDLNSQLRKILNTFESSLDNLLDQHSEKITSISESLVEKFLETQIDKDVTKRKLKKVLSHLVSATKVKIRINPEDMKNLDEETISKIKEQGFDIISDPNVEYGVVAETDMGTVDTTLKFQLTLLDEIFEEVFNINNKKE